MSIREDYLWPPPTLFEWLKMVEEMELPKWVLPNFLLADSLICMSGPAQASFKTWVTFQMIRAITSGEDIGPFKPEGIGNVLLCEEEGSFVCLYERWQWLANSHPLSSEDYKHRIYSHVRQGTKIDDRQRVDEICTLLQEKDICLVVFDTLPKFHTGNENSAQDAGRLTEAFRLMKKARPGISILYLHHLAKNWRDTEDLDGQVRGSGRYSGDFEAHLAIRPPEGEYEPTYNDLFVISNHMPRRCYSMHWVVEEEEERAKMCILECDQYGITEQVLQRCFMVLSPDDEYTDAGLRKAWSMTKMKSREKAQRIQKLMLAEGTLQKRGQKWVVIK